MTTVVMLAGPIAVGKSTLAAQLALAIPARVVSARRVVEELTGLNDAGRTELQAQGSAIDAATEGRWLGDYLLAHAVVERSVVVDSVRTIEQAEHIRRKCGFSVLVYLTAEPTVRAARYHASDDPVKIGLVFQEAMMHPMESGVGALAGLADIKVDTTYMDPSVVAKYVLSALRVLESGAG